MKHGFCLSSLLLSIVSYVSAASVTVPSALPNYYTSVNGQSGANLFNQVHVVTKIGYSSLGYDGLWTAYQKTDLNAQGKIWDMYSNCEFTYITDQCGNYNAECVCYNREHSIPKSWYGGTTSGPGCDIFHLVPTDGQVN